MCLHSISWVYPEIFTFDQLIHFYPIKKKSIIQYFQNCFGLLMVKSSGAKGGVGEAVCGPRKELCGDSDCLGLERYFRNKHGFTLALWERIQPVI